MWTRARPLRLACRSCVFFFCLSTYFTLSHSLTIGSFTLRERVVPYDWNFRSLTVICRVMEQYHREHNNVFLCVALPRHVNTQSNQVDLWAYHSSTLHILTRRIHISLFFSFAFGCCCCCCCVPKHTHIHWVKWWKEQPRHTQIGLCVFLGCYFVIFSEAKMWTKTIMLLK